MFHPGVMHTIVFISNLYTTRRMTQFTTQFGQKTMHAIILILPNYKKKLINCSMFKCIKLKNYNLITTENKVFSGEKRVSE